MKMLTPIVVALLFASCAHHRDVRPGVEGVHRVSIQAETKDQGARNAMSQANHFCEERGRAAAIVKETANYTGDMAEADYKTTKKVGKIAEVIGGSTWAMGRGGVSDAGGIVGLGGATADAIAGEGYTVKMEFKCI